MNQANHPNGYSDFTKVDDRCVGGKTLVMQHMKSHYDKLVGTKPQLKIEAPKRYIHETRKPVHTRKNKLIDEQLEVKVAFRKVANTTKGYVDDGKPVSFNMTGQLKGRYEKEKQFEAQEHELNLKSMNKKLKGKGKAMKDRKKDPYDPVAHPVKFFRRNQELPHNKVEYLTNMPAGSRLVITDDDAKLKEKFDGHMGKSVQISSGVGRASTAQQGRNRPMVTPDFATEIEQGDNSIPTGTSNQRAGSIL